jgi:amidase
MPPLSYDYDDCDATDLATLVRTKRASAQELTDAAIARIEKLDGRINAVPLRFFEQAREVARGPLPEGAFSGVPFLLKNLGAPARGTALSNSTRYLKDYVCEADNTLVGRYREAGLIFLGRTNSSELGIEPFTEPALYGPTHNPWKLGHTAGGSSGGAGAAVAAGMVPAAHGSDGGGSLRIPASCCGVFALKPTRGRVPVGPDRTELWRGLAIDNVISKSVRDNAAFLDVATADDAGAVHHLAPPARDFATEAKTPPGRLRIGFSHKGHLWGTPHADCVAALHDSAKLLADLGHTVEEADVPLDADELTEDFFLFVATELAAEMKRGEILYKRPTRATDFKPSTWLMRMIGQRPSAVDIAMAWDRMQIAGAILRKYLTTYDVLLTPTLGLPPFAHGACSAQGAEAALQSFVARTSLAPALQLPGMVQKAARRAFAFIPYPPLANITGHPSMSVPLSWNADGLPIGSMFTGRFADEATLFRLAAQLESARPWAKRRPPVHAATA